MPAKNYLKKEQKEKLQQALKEEEHPIIRERILMLLLLNDGKTQAEIADFIGCSLKKVSIWCVRGDADNLESLKDKRMEGNYQKATEEYIKLLLETIEKGPPELGYEFGKWTAQRLATYLKEPTGIELSSSQVRRILEKKKYVYLWAKYSLEEKWNPEKRKAFKKKLEEYLRIAKSRPDLLQVWFWDESGFSLSVISNCLKIREPFRVNRRVTRTTCVMVGNIFGTAERDTVPRYLWPSLGNVRARAITLSILSMERGNHREIEDRTDSSRWKNGQKL